MVWDEDVPSRCTPKIDDYSEDVFQEFDPLEF